MTRGVSQFSHALEELAYALQDKVFGPSDQADFDTVATATGMTWAGPGERLTRRAIAVTAEDLPELADQGEKVRGHITSTVRATAQEGSLRQRTQETTYHQLFQDGCAKAPP